MWTESPPCLLGELQAVRVAVEAIEAGARVREADAAVQPSRARRRSGRRRCRAPRARARRRRAGDEMRIGARPLRGAMPCLIAFSTSGCRIRRGTSASSVSGSMSNVDRETILEARLLDLEVLLQELDLLLQRHASARPMRSNVRRSRSLSRLIMRSAAPDRVCTSVEIACSVLNRKCGCSSASSVFSRASTRRVSSCAALSVARLRLAVVPERVARRRRSRRRSSAPSRDSSRRTALTNVSPRHATLKAACCRRPQQRSARPPCRRGAAPRTPPRRARGRAIARAPAADSSGKRRAIRKIAGVSAPGRTRAPGSGPAACPPRSSCRLCDVERRQPVGLERREEAEHAWRRQRPAAPAASTLFACASTIELCAHPVKHGIATATRSRKPSVATAAPVPSVDIRHRLTPFVPGTVF